MRFHSSDLRSLAALCFALSLSTCTGGNPNGTYNGVVELDQRLLGFELGGRIAELRVDRGEAVKKGQVLAILDDTLERTQRPILEADLAQAEAQLKLLVVGPRESEIRQVAEQLAAANAEVQQVERDFARQKPLVDGGVAPQAVLDDLLTKLDAAEARRDSVAQQLRTLQEGSRPEEILAATAVRDAASARVAALEERLTHYQLLAPMDGQILDTTAKEGEVVNAGTSVLLFGEPKRPYVDVFIPVPELAGVKVGQKAEVRPDGEGAPFSGVVEYISTTTEYTPRYLLSEDDRTALVTRVRVRLDDPDERLHAGVPCRVSFGTFGPAS